MSRPRKDGRRNNGRPDTGLTEATVLVRGPADLLDAVRAKAVRDGVTTAEAWRLAARRYVGLPEFSGEGPDKQLAADLNNGLSFDAAIRAEMARRKR